MQEESKGTQECSLAALPLASEGSRPVSWAESLCVLDTSPVEKKAWRKRNRCLSHPWESPPLWKMSKCPG